MVSALVFQNGRLSWLRSSWACGETIPVVSQDTIKELLRVFAYPKFRLNAEEQTELLAEFLPYAETVRRGERANPSEPRCRDTHDQKFLTLAHQAKVDFLVTGDADLLELNERVTFSIVTPAEFEKLIGRNSKE